MSENEAIDWPLYACDASEIDTIKMDDDGAWVTFVTGTRIFVKILALSQDMAYIAASSEELEDIDGCPLKKVEA